jgi:hypothetical protein
MKPNTHCFLGGHFAIEQCCRNYRVCGFNPWLNGIVGIVGFRGFNPWLNGIVGIVGFRGFNPWLNGIVGIVGFRGFNPWLNGIVGIVGFRELNPTYGNLIFWINSAAHMAATPAAELFT